MHKCQNNSVGNVYHLEQMVDQFFPYSQKQLGFDKSVTIVFQSDDKNASKMLGKTAYYDPENMQVTLYTDNRHPKDVMRSLSHELVHHAQNCRGDFTGDIATEEGYAQKNPHLRKMEREAYTKGNLIFRDFEDLIKTGKINIEIDFSKSGDPKMSLKEWKNNERTRLLMEKWGYRQKGTPEQEVLAEGWGYRDEDDDDPTGRPSRRHDNPLKALSSKDYEEKDPADFTGTRAREEKATSALKKGKGLEENDEIEEGEAKWKAMADAPEDPTDAPTATTLQQKRTKKRGEWGKKVRGKSDIRGKRDKPVAAGSKNVMTMGEGDELEEASWDVSDKELGLHRRIDPKRSREEYEEDPAMMADPKTLGMKPMRKPKWGPPGAGGKGGEPAGAYEKDLAAWRAEKQKRYAAQFKEGKISVREAKEITRRIIERIRKEGN